ncbi:MAG TPA: cytochrome c [Terracidiphilus sp.]|jgi:cytochrome c
MFRPILFLNIGVLLVASSTFIQTIAEKGLAQSSSNSGTPAKELYRRDCLICHGANGDGKTGIAQDRDLGLPDWTDPKSLIGRGDQQLFQIIRFGRGKMPAESAGRADDSEVRDLIGYIRTMTRNEAGMQPDAESTGSKK